MNKEKQARKVWVLVNVGTPDAPDTRSVRRYLKEFLNDPFVIDLPWLLRKFLVNVIIVPFRARRSARKYRRIWTKRGAPLAIHLEELVGKLNELTDDSIMVYGAMRYGNPSLEKLLEKLKKSGNDEITILPLYPHFSDSTTETIRQLADKIFASESNPGRVRIIEQFYNHPSYLEVLKRKIGSYKPETFDYILFSYHGLPNRQVEKCHPGIAIDQCTCAIEVPNHGSMCYRATCYATTRILSAQLGIETARYSTTFQSRLTRNWLKPFTDETLQTLGSSGYKRVLVVPASFVADCLETTFEIAEEYKELFIHSGGEELVMTESLNADDDWVSAVKEIIG